MNHARAWYSAAACVLFVSALVPAAGYWSRAGRPAGCALDGQPIDECRQVRIATEEGVEKVFCSVACAELWLSTSGVEPVCIQVADEASGRMLAAESAWYVRSQVIAHGPTVDRRHVFAARAAAERHAAAYYGRLLQGRQRPFARWLAAPAATAKSAATRQVSPKDAAAAAADVP